MHQFCFSKNLNDLQVLNGRIALLAADHELTTGDKGFPETIELVRVARESKIPALVLNPGRAKLLTKYEKVSLVLQCMGGPRAPGSHRQKIADVELAIKLGASAISMQSSFLSNYDDTEITLITELCAEARNCSLPTLLMISGEVTETRNIQDCLAFGRELGVDIIKVPISDKKIIKADFAPLVVMAGGAKRRDIAAVVEQSMNNGYDGICIGRSIIESDAPIEMAKSIISAL